MSKKPAEIPALSAAYVAGGRNALASHYDDWAATYDQDNAAGGFRLPILAAALLARYVPVDDRPILDAGCGTGLAGDNLAILGYRNLVGIDLSPAMLAQAAKLGLYGRLAVMALGEPLAFPDETFGAVIATGVFTEGHAPHASFDELIRVTAKGGYLVFNVREEVYEEQGFRQRQEAMEAEGRWRLRERSDRFRPFTVAETHLVARLFAYEVL
ncbi:MAG: class I SAM-dependent methyltransferase [Pseudomonadota bacterium]